MPALYYLLIPLGFGIGLLGTMIGAGGGFLLAPLLLLMFPSDSPSTLASISLAVVWLNATAGSMAYARAGRVDFQSGRWFALATIPGSILGALTTQWMPRRSYELLMGLILLLLATFLLRDPERPLVPALSTIPNTVERQLVDAEGHARQLSYPHGLGMWLSFVVGFLSSLLGIGGGILHVPLLVQLLHFPVHIATATSHFVLAVMSGTGTLVHVATGAFHVGWRRTLLLGIGVLAGAPLGARLSTRFDGVQILRLLAVALGLVGVRLLIG